VCTWMGRESWWLRRAKCMRHATNIRQQCTAPFAVQWAWHLTRISDRLTTSELLPVTNAHTHTHTHSWQVRRPTDRPTRVACSLCAVRCDYCQQMFTDGYFFSQSFKTKLALYAINTCLPWTNTVACCRVLCRLRATIHRVQENWS